MIYKTISRTLFIALAATAVSCTFEQEDFFEDSASLRVTHTNEKIQQRLVEQSAEGQHGWVIQYFVAGTDEWNGPGFNLFGRFYNSGRVTLAGNHQYLRNGNANKYTEANSTYEMLAEEGPVLSFNTWNDVLTVFEDPVDPTKAPGSLINDGEGMNGDHNLVLAKLNDNDIIFRGERHSAQTRFVPCDRPWEEYIADTETMKNTITNSSINSYYVINEANDTLYFVGLRSGRFNFCERVNDPLSVKSLACVFTPQGFRIEREQTFGDNVFQEFTLTEDGTHLLNADGSVKVIATWDNYIVSRTAVWNFDPDLFTEKQQNLFNQINAEFAKYNSATSLASIGIGKSTGSRSTLGLVFTFYTNAAKTKTNTIGLSLTMEKTAYGQMSIKCTSEDTTDQNFDAVVKNGGVDMGNLAHEFAATISGIYQITPDNYFLPKSGLFEIIEGAGTTFKLN